MLLVVILGAGWQYGNSHKLSSNTYIILPYAGIERGLINGVYREVTLVAQKINQ